MKTTRGLKKREPMSPIYKRKRTECMSLREFGWLRTYEAGKLVKTFVIKIQGSL